MPYILPERREEIDDGGSAQTAGELNFVLTRNLLWYLQKHGTSYATLNEIIGALECCKQEFYRRVIVPYEEKKFFENGDCY